MSPVLVAASGRPRTSADRGRATWIARQPEEAGRRVRFRGGVGTVSRGNRQVGPGRGVTDCEPAFVVPPQACVRRLHGRRDRQPDRRPDASAAPSPFPGLMGPR